MVHFKLLYHNLYTCTHTISFPLLLLCLEKIAFQRLPYFIHYDTMLNLFCYVTFLFSLSNEVYYYYNELLNVLYNSLIATTNWFFYFSSLACVYVTIRATSISDVIHLTWLTRQTQNSALNHFIRLRVRWVELLYAITFQSIEEKLKLDINQSDLKNN